MVLVFCTLPMEAIAPCVWLRWCAIDRPYCVNIAFFCGREGSLELIQE